MLIIKVSNPPPQPIRGGDLLNWPIKAENPWQLLAPLTSWKFGWGRALLGSLSPCLPLPTSCNESVRWQPHSLWQHLLKSCNNVTTSHKNILLRLVRDNVRYNSESWHIMIVFIIETFFGECFENVINLCAKWLLLRVRGIHAIIARSQELFKSVMMTPAPLPPKLCGARQMKGLIMGDAGQQSVSRR